jgi:uncharacterized protein YndB with AHSA1/START domain
METQTLTATIEIAAPPERVWRVLTDVDRWHEWTPSITSARRQGDAPFAVGTRVSVRQPRLLPAVWTITRIEPGRAFDWISRMPGIEVVAHHGLAPNPAGTLATLSLEYRGPLAPLLAWMTRALTERYVALEARGLKARSEYALFRHDGQRG